jgi:ribosome-binding factor A
MRKGTRLSRINDELARVTAGIIRGELKDPRVGAVVSVVKADTTTDLKYCKVYVSVLGDEREQSGTMDALRAASGFVRKRVAETVNLRVTPEIMFVFDDSIAHAMRMQKLIKEVNSV